MAFLNPTDDYLTDIKLEQGKQLSDSVSSIDWSPAAQDHFACTLWDGTLKIYQVNKAPTKGPFSRDNGKIVEKASLNVTTPWPLTCCNWSPDGNAIFLGTSKGEIKAFDTNSGSIIDIGHHSSPINYLKFLPEFGNTLLTCAYENNVHFWSMSTKSPVKTISYSKKIYKAAYGGDILATGMSDEKIGLVNIKALHKKKETDSTELGKYSQIQTIAVNKSGKHLGLGTIDGRVNISFIQNNPVMEYSWVIVF